MESKKNSVRKINFKSWVDNMRQLFFKTPRDRDAVLKILQNAAGNNLINHDSLTMIEGAMAISELRARDIMTPKISMVSVQPSFRLKKIVGIIKESGHSRFPVFDEAHERVIGIMHAKDLLGPLSDGDERSFDIKDATREAMFVPESQRLDVLLREFRGNKNHMAIVTDEYSSVEGLVTIEDILEKIIGEIADEHDYEDLENIKRDEGGYMVNALTPLPEFNKFLKTTLKHDECDTIGGFIVDKFGFLPEQGTSIDVSGFQFTVVRTDRRKIEQLRVVKIK